MGYFEIVIHVVAKERLKADSHKTLLMKSDGF